ncbi:type II secretion system major pseudopilin GspG [Porphyrobacter sp. AAP82]|uniref:type II secretion system major pseudopilin GspG n=1 Tax=Porphyrobacter sp. AAP82 TaxID=1248917 RepID=UPI000476B25E|nr:type II secretion system major pseudopilin GspG [Porphyrobacter sp. AAP82]
MKNIRSKFENGFTLVELIIVLAIIGLIMALVAPRLMEQFDKSKVVAARAQIRSLESALTSMRLDIDRYPSSAEGLALLQLPAADVAESWQGPYLAEGVPKDPWGRPFIYREPQTPDGRPAVGTLGSDGSAGGTGTARDIFVGGADAGIR